MLKATRKIRWMTLTLVQRLIALFALVFLFSSLTNSDPKIMHARLPPGLVGNLFHLGDSPVRTFRANYGPVVVHSGATAPTGASPRSFS